MSTSINTVAISGNLARDAKLFNDNVCNFVVAVNETRKNSDTGDYEEVPSFITCVLFGKRAKALAQYLTKGVRVVVQGSLRQSSYEKDGAKRYTTDVVVQELTFMSPKKSVEPDDEQPF